MQKIDQSWIISQHFIENLISMQLKLVEESIGLVLWEQCALQQAGLENIKWLSHIPHLSSQPYTLFRYIRMNWQKPWMEYYAQATTTMQMISHLYLERLLPNK